MGRNVFPVMENGIFWTVQGEGHLRGFQMAFVRFAGCSVGCPECDTDFSPKRSSGLSTSKILQGIDRVTPANSRDRWVWLTGGDPADQDLGGLVNSLHAEGYSVAVATSGTKRVIPPVDWLSVSYHGKGPFLQKYGSELKIVEGLNGLDPFDFLDRFPDDQTDFMYRYVQPLSVAGVESKKSLARCLEFLKAQPNWALSRQDHAFWGVR